MLRDSECSAGDAVLICFERRISVKEETLLNQREVSFLLSLSSSSTPRFYLIDFLTPSLSYTRLRTQGKPREEPSHSPLSSSRSPDRPQPVCDCQPLNTLRRPSTSISLVNSLNQQPSLQKADLLFQPNHFSLTSSTFSSPPPSDQAAKDKLTLSSSIASVSALESARSSLGLDLLLQGCEGGLGSLNALDILLH